MRQPKFRVLYLILTVLLTLTTFAVLRINNDGIGTVFPWLRTDYGLLFNSVRASLEQPIIETYFIDKHPDWYKRKVWITPDSLKPLHLHQSKLYWTEKGEIMLEIDSYDYLDTSPIDTFLSREYSYNNDSIIYELHASEEGVTRLNQILTESEYDSIIKVWTRRINNR